MTAPTGSWYLVSFGLSGSFLACSDQLCQIYLRTSPLVAYQRMVTRARAEEAAIPLSYFQQMHQARHNNVHLTALRIIHYIVWVSSVI